MIKVFVMSLIVSNPDLDEGNNDFHSKHISCPHCAGSAV